MDGDISTRVTVVPTPSGPRAQGCLVVLHPPDAAQYGQRIELRDRLSIGRGVDNDLVLDNDTVSRRHCRIARDEAGAFEVVDMGSKNGTYVGDTKVARRSLLPGELLKVGTTILKLLAGDDLELQFLETAHRMAIEDPLTGLPNRRALEQAMVRDLARTRRTGQPL